VASGIPKGQDLTTHAVVSPSTSFDALFRESPPSGISMTARNLSKRFGSLEVLREIDLFIPAGQFLAIVGRSGCGKSTLLRLLCGLDEPTAGWIRMKDEEASSRVARVMFQEPRLLPWARVLDNVEIGLGGVSLAGGARERARETLAAVGLENRAGDWPSILSGGQKQRVALARALVSRPQLLAFDEPLGALDALTRMDMQRLLERVWQNQKFTAVLVTHDVAEALTLADRIVIIENASISLDLAVPLPRPRRRGNVELAHLEEKILQHLLREETGHDAI
jgi:sulfonate transport system ATP-binding protein